MDAQTRVISIVPKNSEQCRQFIEWLKGRFDDQLALIIISPLHVGGKEVTEQNMQALQEAYASDAQIVDWRFQSVLYPRNFVILTRYCDLIINGLGWGVFQKYFDRDSIKALGSIPVLSMDNPEDANKNVLLLYKMGLSSLEEIRSYFDLFSGTRAHESITLAILPADNAKRSFDDQKKLINYLRKRCKRLAVKTIIQDLDELTPFMPDSCGVVYDHSIQDVVSAWSQKISLGHQASFAFTSLR